MCPHTTYFGREEVMEEGKLKKLRKLRKLRKLKTIVFSNLARNTKAITYVLNFLDFLDFQVQKREVPEDIAVLGDSRLNEGGLLLSHIALQYHRRRRA